MDVKKARETIRMYGSSNCWTGTSGTLAAVAGELLDMYEAMQHESFVSLERGRYGWCLVYLTEDRVSRGAIKGMDLKDVMDAYGRVCGYLDRHWKEVSVKNIPGMGAQSVG